MDVKPGDVYRHKAIVDSRYTVKELVGRKIRIVMSGTGNVQEVTLAQLLDNFEKVN